MMDKLKSFRIPFKGLKEGIHHFEFRLDGAFFEVFENEELAEASTFNVELQLDKKATLIEVNFDIKGRFVTDCDRCAGELVIPIDTDREMIAKYHGDLDDDDVIPLGDQDSELDVARPIYETVVMALPLKRAHDEEDCDPEVLERLDTYSHSEDTEETDPRWDALKKLK